MGSRPEFWSRGSDIHWLRDLVSAVKAPGYLFLPWGPGRWMQSAGQWREEVLQLLAGPLRASVTFDRLLWRAAGRFLGLDRIKITFPAPAAVRTGKVKDGFRQSCVASGYGAFSPFFAFLSI